MRRCIHNASYSNKGQALILPSIESIRYYANGIVENMALHSNSASTTYEPGFLKLLDSLVPIFFTGIMKGMSYNILKFLLSHKFYIPSHLYQLPWDIPGLEINNKMSFNV